MNHWKKHELRHFLLSSKSCIFPSVIYSGPRAPSQARVYNLPPVALGFIALGLIKSPLTAREACSTPQCGGLVASSCGRERTPGCQQPSRQRLHHYPPQPRAARPPLPPAALPPRTALPARGRRPAAWVLSFPRVGGA